MSTPAPAHASTTPRGRAYLASAARWAWLFAGMTLASAASGGLSAYRVWRIGEGLPLRLRLAPSVTLLPTLGLSLAEVALAVLFARAARAFALGREPRLAPAARAFRYLLAVFFVAGGVALAAGALVLFARGRVG